MRVTPLFLAIGLAAALDNGLARTPQLGWVGAG
jgi:alpha-galactosidase